MLPLEELPFEDSRRLTGPNLFFASPGAVLEVIGVDLDEALLAAWRGRIAEAAARLQWPRCVTVVRAHAKGTSLAVAAPHDQLFLATEVNEWALAATLREREPRRFAALEAALIAAAVEAAADNAANPAARLPPVIDEAAALARFVELQRLECNPRLTALLEAAAARDLPCILDDDALTLGAGTGGRTFALATLPDVAAVRWPELHDVPTAVVTGSNGKTTSVRLLAACARAQGWHTGYNCTDGVYWDDEPLASGDYSGPAGARRVLRDPRTQAAVLETARGGILRRGMAVSRAAVALVTNVSADHFGEYGIDDLAGLADTKLSIAAAVGKAGLLVLNADDAQLQARAPELERRLGRSPACGWFSAVDGSAHLRRARARGEPTCGVEAGHLRMSHHGEHDLGVIADMPLTLGGIATYNIENLAGAALAASALGVSAANIAHVCGTFGADVDDNPGRMMRFEWQGATVLVDYAHNPDGLRGFLEVVRRLRAAHGRFGLLLGQAGNRSDADLAALAEVAASFAPDFIVIKENENQLRGRAPREVPRLLQSTLLAKGLPAASLLLADTELDGAQQILRWARSGDLVALPLHAKNTRSIILSQLAAPRRS